MSFIFLPLKYKEPSKSKSFPVQILINVDLPAPFSPAKILIEFLLTKNEALLIIVCFFIYLNQRQCPCYALNQS